MKIPRKINPDNLKNSIVQIIIIPACSPELLLGYTSQALSGYFKFIVGGPYPELPKMEKGIVVFQPLEQGYFISEDNKFKLNVTGNQLVFNQQNFYSGWEEYFNCINKTLELLFTNNIIKSVSRIGVRYISEFPAVNVFGSTTVKVNFGTLSDFKIDATQFRTEYEEEHYRVIVTLINRLNTAVIDVDVIQNFKESSNDIKVITETIHQGHTKQKEIFFGLLTREFLETLNPEY